MAITTLKLALQRWHILLVLFCRNLSLAIAESSTFLRNRPMNDNDEKNNIRIANNSIRNLAAVKPSNNDDPSFSGLENITPYIINGNDATKGSYPYMVLLTDRSGRLRCGGSLIAPDVVLTAAHCQRGILQYAIVGRYSKYDSLEDFETIEVQEETYSSDYVHGNFDYDVMLLQLKERSTKQTITLDFDQTRFDNPNNNLLDLYAIGFGTIHPSSTVIPDTIQEVALKYVPNEVCEQSSYDQYTYNGLITENMLCAQDLYKGACRGDSGGPLVIRGSDPSRDIQVGIISWGFGCAHPSFPSVFARVSALKEFIRFATCSLSDVPPSYMECEEFNSILELPKDSFHQYSGDHVVSRSFSVPVTLTITFDRNAYECSWAVYDGVTNMEVASAPAGTYTFEDDTTELLDLLPGRPYLFTIFDDGNDGMRLNAGTGYSISAVEQAIDPDEKKTLVLLEGTGDYDNGILKIFDVPSNVCLDPTDIDNDQVADCLENPACIVDKNGNALGSDDGTLVGCNGNQIIDTILCPCSGGGWKNHEEYIKECVVDIGFPAVMELGLATNSEEENYVLARAQNTCYYPPCTSRLDDECLDAVDDACDCKYEKVEKGKEWKDQSRYAKCVSRFLERADSGFTSDDVLKRDSHRTCGQKAQRSPKL